MLLMSALFNVYVTNLCTIKSLLLVSKFALLKVYNYLKRLRYLKSNNSTNFPTIESLLALINVYAIKVSTQLHIPVDA